MKNSSGGKIKKDRGGGKKKGIRGELEEKKIQVTPQN